VATDTGIQRGVASLQVTDRPRERKFNVVSLAFGYLLKPGSSVTIDIDGQKFFLFTEGEHAWTRDPEGDDELVKALALGTRAIVRGTSAQGTSTADSYALNGFRLALAATDKVCGVERGSDFVVASTPPDLSQHGAPVATRSAVDLTRLKFSDIRQPYPLGVPELFQIIVANAGASRITELTIGFTKNPSRRSCSGSLSDYDGFRKFTVDLQPGDSVTLEQKFSAQAKAFCIISAR
jgi:hypothetical protein